MLAGPLVGAAMDGLEVLRGFLVAPGGAHGGVDGHGEEGPVLEPVGDAAQVLALLGLDAGGVEGPDGVVDLCALLGGEVALRGRASVPHQVGSAQVVDHALADHHLSQGTGHQVRHQAEGQRRQEGRAGDRLHRVFILLAVLRKTCG